MRNISLLINDLTVRRLACTLAAATLFATIASADNATWNGGDGNWSTGSNWSTGTTAPGAGDTATITGGAADQTVTYDSAASGQLGTLILDQAGSGFTNTLLISKTGSVATPSLTLANDLALGGDSGLGTVRLQLGTGSYLKIGSSTAGTLIIGQNAILLGTGASSSVYPTIDGNVILNAGGLITLNASGNEDTRTTILGNFTANGGTIERTSGNAGQGILQLKGATNVINNVTFSDAQASTKGMPYIYLNGTGDQSFSTNVTVANLAFRATTGTKTLSGTGTITNLRIGNYTSATNLTFKLGSDLKTTNGFVNGGWGGATGANLALDTNGHDFSVTNGLSLVAGDATSVNWTLSNTGSTPSEISATAFTFHSNASSTTTLNGNLTLHATGTGANAFTNATFTSSVRFLYTGTAASFSSTNALGSIEIGDGTTASTLTRSSSNLTASGDLKINTNATYASGGWSTSLQGAANLTGNGTYKAVNSTGNVSWAAGSTGGFSAGNGRDNIGTFHMSAAGTVSGIPTVTLRATSISTFDIASLASFDTVDLGAFSITYAGTLELNFMGGYTPEAGDTFHLFQSASELNSVGGTFAGTLAGNFSTITSNLTGYEFAFDASTGILSVTTAPIPEPATLAAIVGISALAGAIACKRRRN
ncbi:beta strand repeat-containing protein [Geminisphaera colitermitum]|uniref:beta strand repeat-containing protein n=1 Tax=Geminisphaera colitermitum TaxID=1148786 RepID=UPI000158D4CF|nr:cell wall anchor protein [Geminisphaera colitermitum]